MISTKQKEREDDIEVDDLSGPPFSRRRKGGVGRLATSVNLLLPQCFFYLLLGPPGGSRRLLDPQSFLILGSCQRSPDLPPAGRNLLGNGPLRVLTCENLAPGISFFLKS